MTTKEEINKLADQLITNTQEFVKIFNQDNDDQVINLFDVLDYLAITGLKIVKITQEDIDQDGTPVTTYAYIKALQETKQLKTI